jgi:hypothetical protein
MLVLHAPTLATQTLVLLASFLFLGRAQAPEQDIPNIQPISLVDPLGAAALEPNVIPVDSGLEFYQAMQQARERNVIAYLQGKCAML